VDGLLGGAALPVHRRRGHGLREAGGEDGVPGGVHGLLADLVDGAADDVVHERGVDSGAVDEGAQRVGEEFDGVDVGQGAAGLALADGSADGFDDDGVAHGMPPRVSLISKPTVTLETPTGPAKLEIQTLT